MNTNPSKHSFTISGDAETVSHVNHELKSLITSIKTYGQLLERKLQKNDPSLVPYVNKLDVQVDKLFYNIANLFDLHLFEMKIANFQSEEIAVKDLLHSVFEKIKKQFPNLEITLSKIPYIKILADRNYVERALLYIVQNAAENAENKPIEILISQNKNLLHITVVNNLKMDKKIQDTLFTPFLYNEHTKGLGLSLYIAKKIINAHKGKLEVAYSSNKTSITCIFPIS